MQLSLLYWLVLVAMGSREQKGILSLGALEFYTSTVYTLNTPSVGWTGTGGAKQNSRVRQLAQSGQYSKPDSMRDAIKIA